MTPSDKRPGRDGTEPADKQPRPTGESWEERNSYPSSEPPSMADDRTSSRAFEGRYRGADSPLSPYPEAPGRIIHSTYDIFEEFPSESEDSPAIAVPARQQPSPRVMFEVEDCRSNAGESDRTDEVATTAASWTPPSQAQTNVWAYNLWSIASALFVLSGALGVGGESRPPDAALAAALIPGCVAEPPLAGYAPTAVPDRVVIANDLAEVSAESLDAPIPAASSGDPAPIMGTAVATPETDREAVEIALEQYRRAFNTLDASAAMAVWPSANSRTLRAGFARLAAQTVEFDYCDITIAGARATAGCGGRVTTMLKSSRRITRVIPRAWSFSLKKVDGQWVIGAVE